MQYGILLIIHLLCAVVFIGIVAFEALILEGIRRRLPASLMAEVEAGIHTRARWIMPLIIELICRHKSGFYLGPNLEWMPVKTPTDHNNTVFQERFALLGVKAGYKAPVGTGPSSLTGET